MSLPLKIRIVRLNQTKAMKFAPNMSVAEVLRQIKEKTEEGGEDHGLFQPGLEGKRAARWLKPERVLQYYDLQPNDELDYKKKHRPIKIKLQDETIKTVLVDDTLSVAEIVKVIGEKMSMSNADEFSLKEDGKEQWLNDHQSLHEQGVADDSLLIFRKKFFISDGTVSADDPLALHLVYVESRDAILTGNHPCTQDEAVMFAALQCQIVLGSWQKERKIEPKEYLPPVYHKHGKKLEPMIQKEYRKLVGMKDVTAKYRYVQLCRSLKTYGITFFQVKQRIKGQKKPKPILLGITRDAIVFMDEETKEQLKEYKLTKLRRWAASPSTFTLDFGDHEDDYMILVTNEAESISQLLGGYIDLLLKKRNESSIVLEQDDSNVASEEPVAPIRSQALSSITTSMIGGYNQFGGQQSNILGNQQGISKGPAMGVQAQRAMPTNVQSAQAYVGMLVSDLSQRGENLPRNTALSPYQWKKQLASNTDSVMQSFAKLMAAMPPNQFDKAAMDSKAAEIATNLAQLVAAARNAGVRRDGSEDIDLLNSAKAVADAIKDLLGACKDLSEHPDDPKAMERFMNAQKALQAATAYLSASSRGALSDDASQKLLMESSKNVLAATQDLFQVGNAVAANTKDAKQKQELLAASEKAKAAAEQLNSEVQTFAPAIMSSAIQKQIEDSSNELARLLQTVKFAAKVRDDDNSPLSLAAKAVSDAIAQLLQTTQVAEARDNNAEFAAAASDIFNETARLMGAEGNPAQINQSTKALIGASTKLVNAAKAAGEEADEETKQMLLSFARGVAEAAKKLVAVAGAAAANPNDQNAFKELQDACQRLAEATIALVGDTGEKAALHNLRTQAKLTAASATHLVSTARTSASTMADAQSSELLRASSRQAAEAIARLVNSLHQAYQNPDDPNVQKQFVKETQECSTQAYKLVAASKTAVPKVTDPTNKALLKQAADNAAAALQKLLAANKAFSASLGQADVDEAIDTFGAEEANIDSALMDVESGTLETGHGQNADGALQLLNLASKQVAAAVDELVDASKNKPDDLGRTSKGLADAIRSTNTASNTLASTSGDKQYQRGVLNASKELTREGRNILTSARAVANNNDDPNLIASLDHSAKRLAEALALLLAAAKGGQNSAKECDDAANAIQAAILKLEIKKGDPKDFPAHAEDLENNVKATQSAAFALVTAARNNPKQLGPAAKTTASTVTPLIISANLTAGSTTNAETAKALQTATKVSANEISRLVLAAKNAGLKDDAQFQDDLLAASNAVSDSLNRLLQALNAASPGQKGMDDAIKLLIEVTAKMGEGTDRTNIDAATQLEELKRGTARLGEATKNIISASRSEPEKLGPLSKDAAAAISTIAAAAKGLSQSSGNSSIYDQEINAVRESTAELVGACDSKDPTAKQKIVKAAKDVTVGTQKLVEDIKQNTASLSDAEAQKKLTGTGQSIATATSVLVNSAKAAATQQPGAQAKLYEARDNLLKVLDDLENNENAKQQSAKAKKLLTATKDTSEATTKMVQVGKNVLKHPGDVGAQTELTNAARSVGSAIKALLDSAKALGEIDLDQFIEKISHAITDLDSATISATVGLLENTAPPGKTTQLLEEELVEVSRDLATSIKNLVQAQRENPTAMAKAAKVTADLIPRLADVAKQCAGTMSDMNRQSEELGLSKSVADAALELMQACKQNDPKEIANQAKNSSQAIAKLLGSLKGGVIALRDCDEASKSILEAGKGLEQPQSHTNKSYAESQRELQDLAKEIVAGISKVVSSAKAAPQEVGNNSKNVAAVIPKFVAAIQDATQSITEAKAQQGMLTSARDVVAASSKIIQNAKVVAADPKNSKNQQQLSAVYKEVTDAIAGLVAAIRAGATGELKCEAAIESINRNIAELDGAALYAATGQLNPESDDQDIETVQGDFVNSIQSASDDIKKLVAAVNKTQQDLGLTSADVAEKFDKLAKDAKATAALMNSLIHQQELLTGAKATGVAFQSLVNNGLRLQKDPENAQIKKQLNESSQRATDAVAELTQLANNAAAAASSGIKDLEVSKKGTLQLLEDFDKIQGNPQAGAHDVLKAAKGLADSVAIILAHAGSSDDPQKLVQAANDSYESAKQLTSNSKGAVRLAADAKMGQKIIDAVKASLQVTASFLDAAKVQRKSPNPETGKATSDANDEVVQRIGELVEASKCLPGSEEALKLFQQTDELEQLAEKELMSAAAAIEDAARTLLEAKRRQLEARKNKDSPLPDEEITEAILDAARAITMATGTLVAAATAAQKELVSKGKVSNAQSVYRRDPAWAKGLISAAQQVAGTVGDLVVAANHAAQGKAAEEELVASAKGVAAATARLVFASRAKADPFSPTQKKLSEAAKAVASATQSLVEAAKSSSNLQEEEDAKPSWDTTSTTAQRKAEIDAQTKILKLQKELERERNRLGEIRKAEYKDANTNVDTDKAKQLLHSNSGGGTGSGNNVSRPQPQPPVKTLPATKSSGGPVKNVYTLDELKTRPPGVDVSKLEQYLSDEEFVKLFKTSKADFLKLPVFKRNSEKQKHGLF